MIPFVPAKPIRGGRPLDRLYMQLDSDPDWTCQAKINGQRGIWDGRALWHRTGLRVYDRAITDWLPSGTMLDGEIKDGTFWAFDMPDVNAPLDVRLAALADLGIERVPMDVEWAAVKRNGWEGVVFKRLSSLYPRPNREGVTFPGWVKYRAEWL